MAIAREKRTVRPEERSRAIVQTLSAQFYPHVLSPVRKGILQGVQAWNSPGVAKIVKVEEMMEQVERYYEGLAGHWLVV
jgi:hypothetical protein